MDYRHFELHDALCEALIALEAGDRPAAARAVQKALALVEADWLATPTELGRVGAPPGPTPTAADDDEDD